MSFFDLTPPANDPAPSDLFEDCLSDLSETEFDTLHDAACPLYEKILDAIDAYANTQKHLSMMTVLYALHMTLGFAKQEFAASTADA